MELDGAEKDADGRKADVPGGVSRKLGCCTDSNQSRTRRSSAAAPADL
jgi:hypothetical protein